MCALETRGTRSSKSRFASTRGREKGEGEANNGPSMDLQFGRTAGVVSVSVDGVAEVAEAAVARYSGYKVPLDGDCVIPSK